MKQFYYRSDDRPPHIIFGEGFTPRKKPNPWRVRDAIRFGKRKHAVSDAEFNSTICMSNCFQSAAIFPYNYEAALFAKKDQVEKDTYIYYIWLPTQTKLKLENITADLILDTGDPPEQCVYDLHDLQLQELRKISYSTNLSEDRMLNACGIIYGYESITNTVKPEQIALAVQCINRKYKEEKSATKTFDLGEIFINNNFSGGEDALQQAINDVNLWKEKNAKAPLSTSNRNWSLGGLVFSTEPSEDAFDPKGKDTFYTLFESDLNKYYNHFKRANALFFNYPIKSKKYYDIANQQFGHLLPAKLLNALVEEFLSAKEESSEEDLKNRIDAFYLEFLKAFSLEKFISVTKIEAILNSKSTSWVCDEKMKEQLKKLLGKEKVLVTEELTARN